MARMRTEVLARRRVDEDAHAQDEESGCCGVRIVVRCVFSLHEQ